MIQRYKYLIALAVHIILFLIFTISFWQTREPDATFSEFFEWYIVLAILLFKLLPLFAQLLIEVVAVSLFAVFTFNMLRGKQVFVIWNVSLLLVWSFPLAVSAFGSYVGP